MPLVEFQCQHCGHVFELLLASAKTANQAICPKCGAKEPERRWSAFASRTSGNGGCASRVPGFT